jgi:hypothetical protein
MAEKCALCGNEIKESFLEKLKGTRVFIKEGEKNKEFLVCNECQKKHKDKLKEELKRK